MNTQLIRRCRFRAVITAGFSVVAAVLLSGAALAASNLAEKATNPIADLIQLQIQDQFNWKNHNIDSSSNTFIVQPVIPVKLPWDAVPLMVTRTTATFISTPDFGSPIGRQNSLGDISIIAPMMPDLGIEGITIGIGPALSAPLASNDLTGSGKWSGGPVAVILNARTKGLQWGILGWHLWSFAGESDRADVSQTFFQPFVVKHFDKGWYAGTPDVPGTYNWKSDNWTFPLGLRIGRVTKIGKQPINLFAEAFTSPWDDGFSPKWSVKLNFTLLFPK